MIIGTKNLSAIGTLVERTTNYTMLLHLPDGYTPELVRDALAAKIKTLPEVLRASLTWDQGPEMGKWKQVAIDADIDIYFCDPHKPWQRATNENTNGLLRQYFPKSSDLSVAQRRGPRLGRRRTQRPTTQTPRIQETDRTDRTLAVALTARIRRSATGTPSRPGLTDVLRAVMVGFVVSSPAPSWWRGRVCGSARFDQVEHRERPAVDAVEFRGERRVHLRHAGVPEVERDLAQRNEIIEVDDLDFPPGAVAGQQRPPEHGVVGAVPQLPQCYGEFIQAGAGAAVVEVDQPDVAAVKQRVAQVQVGVDEPDPADLRHDLGHPSRYRLEASADLRRQERPASRAVSSPYTMTSPKKVS